MFAFLHHIGTFLLLAASILLIITCISAPVVHDIALLRIDLGNVAGSHSNVAFGTFGYCINNLNGADSCTKSQIGYSPAAVMNQVDGTQFSEYAESTTKALTKAMILHPIACGLNFIAFMLAAGAGVIGSLAASLLALLAFLITAVIMIIDFVMFSVVRSNVNDNNTDAQAYYGNAAWTILVSAICSLLGTIIVFLTCCTGRRSKRRNVSTKTEYVSPPRAEYRPRRKWFGRR